jgi:hypothetical protein
VTTRHHSLRGDAAAMAVAAFASLLVPGCGDAVDHRPAAWEYISPAIMQPNCATTSCHSQAAAVSGLDFSTPDHGYTSLTGLWVWIVDPNGTAAEGCRPYGNEFVCQRNHRPLVTPYDPAQSRLVQMLRATGAPRMPPDRPLPEADIALIEKWILDGARQNVNDTGRDATVPVDSAADGGAGDGATSDAEAGTDGGGDSAGSEAGAETKPADTAPGAGSDDG